MTLGLPPYLQELEPSRGHRVEDGLFWPSGFLFPENREELWPQRQFMVRGLENNFEFDESVEEIQELGLQYSVFVQMVREEGYGIEAPRSWCRHQALWTDIPVFSEEICEWHFPRIQRGFNTDQIPLPEFLRPELNRPEYLGYLPNGDLVAYWEIAERLADAFDIELEPIPSTIDGRCLVVGLGCHEEELQESPLGQGSEVGVVLSAKELGQLEEVLSYIAGLGGTPQIYKPNPSFTMFYRLHIPVFRSESGLNTYVDVRWDSVDVSFQRLTGFSFGIYDNPVTRAQPLFSTEQGNLVASREYLEQLRQICESFSVSWGKQLAIVRTP